MENIGATGAILAAVKSYDYEVSTSKEVSTVTFNDIDNNQTVTLNGLDGSKLVKAEILTKQATAIQLALEMSLKPQVGSLTQMVSNLTLTMLKR